MIRVHLSRAERTELQALTRQQGVSPALRERLEMVRLADAGWRIPQIARYLGRHEQTVRKAVKAYVAGGFAGLPRRRPPGRPPRLTPLHLAALEQLLDETARTWTIPQLGAWLAREHQVAVHPDHLRRLLRRRRFRWKRTKQSVAHKRDPVLYETKQAALAQLRADAQAGMLDLYFLDQSGFAPTLPIGYTWARQGVRKVIPYEAPERRRVNVVGALAPYAAGGPRLVFESRRTDQGKYDAAAHLRFVGQQVAELPPVGPPAAQRERPCVVVVDNYSVHRSRLVQEHLSSLEARGVQFFFLPPYSPELNDIERLWRPLKYQELPERTYPTAVALQDAVDAALTKRAQQLRASPTPLRRAA